MKIKKILIMKPKVTEIQNGFHYGYPKNYNPNHARHICFNYTNHKILKGGSVAEGMVIYEADEIEIKSLLQENGIEEINYDKAKIKGKKWKPKQIINGIEKNEFDIKYWIKDKSEISNKKLA